MKRKPPITPQNKSITAYENKAIMQSPENKTSKRKPKRTSNQERNNSGAGLPDTDRRKLL